MGSITLSCGCLSKGEIVDVRLRDVCCDAIDGYINAVIYASYCPDCAEKMRRAGALIVSDEEEDGWLKGRAALQKQGADDGR